LEAAGVPTGRVQDMAEALADPQVLARNMVLPVAPRPGGPAFVAAGNPIKMSTLAEPAGHAPAPALDGDRQAVLDWLAAVEAPP
ncbi:MAG: CoA transferase, partial [Rhodobacteraceae bacterium]|nr:CoA transferase [Paracoccaceae bacterium]